MNSCNPQEIVSAMKATLSAELAREVEAINDVQELLQKLEELNKRDQKEIIDIVNEDKSIGEAAVKLNKETEAAEVEFEAKLLSEKDKALANSGNLEENEISYEGEKENAKALAKFLLENADKDIAQTYTDALYQSIEDIDFHIKIVKDRTLSSELAQEAKKQFITSLVDLHGLLTTHLSKEIRQIVKDNPQTAEASNALLAYVASQKGANKKVSASKELMAFTAQLKSNPDQAINDIFEKTFIHFSKEGAINAPTIFTSGKFNLTALQNENRVQRNAEVGSVTEKKIRTPSLIGSVWSKFKSPSSLLAAIPNFFEYLDKGPYFKQFWKLLDKDIATPKAAAGIQAFKRFRDSVHDALNEKVLESEENWLKLSPAKPLYKRMHEEPINYLRNTSTDGNLDSNISTAIALELTNLVGMQGNTFNFNNDEDIERILGVSNLSSVSPHVISKLRNGGTLRRITANEVGERILRNTNLKFDSKNFDGFFEERLATSLGEAAIAVGYELNIFVDGLRVKTDVFQGWKLGNFNVESATEDGDLNADETVFIKLKEHKSEFTPRVQSIKDSFEDARKVFDAWFNSNTSERDYTTKPVKPNTSVKRTPMQVGPVREEGIAATNNQEFQVVENFARQIKKFGWDDVKQFMGYVDPKTVHKSRRPNQEGINRDITRRVKALEKLYTEYDLAKAKGEKYPIHLEQRIVANLRQIVNANTIDYQNSKTLHRWAIGLKGWDFEIDTSVDDFTATPEYEAVMLSIALGFGIGIDDIPRQQSLKLMEEYIAEHRKAIDIIQNNLNSSLPYTDADKAILQKAVKAGADGGHALLALDTYARFEDAMEKGAKDYVHQLSVEVDGKTNGAAWAFMQIAPDAGKYHTRQTQVGLLREEDKATDYATNKANKQDSFQDLYQDGMRLSKDEIQRRLDGTHTLIDIQGIVARAKREDKTFEEAITDKDMRVFANNLKKTLFAKHANNLITAFLQKNDNGDLTEMANKEGRNLMKDIMMQVGIYAAGRMSGQNTIAFGSKRLNIRDYVYDQLIKKANPKSPQNLDTTVALITQFINDTILSTTQSFQSESKELYDLIQTTVMSDPLAKVLVDRMSDVVTEDGKRPYYYIDSKNPTKFINGLSYRKEGDPAKILSTPLVLKPEDVKAAITKAFDGQTLTEDNIGEAILEFGLDDILPQVKSEQGPIVGLEAVFIDRVQKGLGDAAYDAITGSEGLGEMIAARKSFLDGAIYMNNIYVDLFNAILDKRTKQKGEPLSKEEETLIEDELIAKGLYPSIAHFGTPRGEDGIPNFREMLAITHEAFEDLEKGKQEEENIYSQAKLSFKDGVEISTGPKTTLKSITHHGRRKRPAKDIGVKAFVLAIHALDAAWATKILKDLQDMGINVAHVFDAFLMSPKDMQKVTEYINEQFIKMNAEYSIMGAMQERLDHFQKTIENDKEIQDLLLRHLSSKDIDESGGVIGTLDLMYNEDGTLEDFKKYHEQSEVARQTSLQEIDYVNQGMLPEASYHVTAEDKANFPKDKYVPNTENRGSSDQRVREDQITKQWTESLTAVNAVKIFETIEDLDRQAGTTPSAEHNAALDEVIEDIVLPGLNLIDGIVETRFAQTTLNQNIGEFTGDGEDRSILIAAAENKATSPNPLSNKEIAAHEYLHAVFVHYFQDPNNYLYREAAERLYNRAREVIQPNHNHFLPSGTSWSDATAAEKRVAQSRWDHIFSNPVGALDEFIVMARTNEQLMNALKDVPLGWDKGTKLSQRMSSNPFKTVGRFIRDIVVNALSWLSGQKLKLKSNESVYDNLDQLLKDIIQVNHNQKESLWDKTNNVVFGAYDTANEKIKQGVYNGSIAVANKINRMTGRSKEKFETNGGKALEREKFKEYANIPYTFVKEFVSEALNNKHIESLSNLAQELTGLGSGDIGWRDRLLDVKRRLDNQRKNIKEGISESLQKFFDPKNPLTVNESRAAIDVVLKTDLSTLLEQGYTLNEANQFLTDTTILDSEISKTKQAIESEFDYKAANWMKNQSEGLGILMAKGIVAKRGQSTNAYDIVRQITLNKKHRVEIPNLEAAEELVDRLASLEALRYTDADKKRTVSKVILREANKTEGANGIETLMYYHNAFKQRSLEENFGGSKTGTWKGYTKENFSPDAQVVTAVDSPRQEAIMRKKGYKKVKGVRRDNLHKGGKPLALYKSNIGHNRMNAGVISLTGEQHKGSSILDGLNSIMESPLNKDIAIKKVKAIVKQSELEARRMLNGDVAPNMERPYMLPVIDQNTGETANMRYVMSMEEKDTLLKRDDRIFEVMGNMYASIHDKKVTPELNKLAFDRIESDWEKYSQEKKKTISGSPKYTWRMIGPNSENYKDREIYRMLPSSTQFEANKRFPDGQFPIREDLANYIFGNRDVTVTGAMKSLSEILPNDSAIPYSVLMSISMADRLYREVVQLSRVHQSVTVPAVTIGNILSNNLVLLADGIPPNYILKHMGTAIIGMRKYQKARNEIIKLEGELLAKQGAGQNVNELSSRIKFLEASMASNPVHELVEEGLFPAIVEDVNVSALMARDNRYIGKAGEFLEERAREFGVDWIIKGGREITMMPGSRTFAWATAANQYGDFVARYIQYKYNTEQRGMDKNTAVHTALTDFVYYDEPTDPRLKAMNDYGIWMFSKFFLRIQRVYAKLLTEKPAGIATISLMDAMVVDLDNVWIGDYFLNVEKAWNRLNLNPYDPISKAFGMPAFSWLNPFAYAQ